MPPVEFEPSTSASERPQAHALDRAATGINAIKCEDNNRKYLYKKCKSQLGVSDCRTFLHSQLGMLCLLANQKFFLIASNLCLDFC
jgi:hypothetical protein